MKRDHFDKKTNKNQTRDAEQVLDAKISTWWDSTKRGTQVDGLQLNRHSKKRVLQRGPNLAIKTGGDESGVWRPTPCRRRRRQHANQGKKGGKTPLNQSSDVSWGGGRNAILKKEKKKKRSKKIKRWGAGTTRLKRNRPSEKGTQRRRGKDLGGANKTSKRGGGDYINEKNKGGLATIPQHTE